MASSGVPLIQQILDGHTVCSCPRTHRVTQDYVASQKLCGRDLASDDQRLTISLEVGPLLDMIISCHSQGTR